jgi:hypothetical protein
MAQEETGLEFMEFYLQSMAKDGNHFPAGSLEYFKRYQQIKSALSKDIYKWIGAGTSSEDQGVYTDHGIDHFNAVIRYAGKLVGLDSPEIATAMGNIRLTPYETFLALVSILLHDAGNVSGRYGHETRTFKILNELGPAVCPDRFETRIIATIAQVHGGKTSDKSGNQTKDTIRNSTLEDKDSYQGIGYRPRAIAALVRFADEICEDRSRAASYMIKDKALPAKSEIFHHYANSITSAEVDLPSKRIQIKYELSKDVALVAYGKDNGEGKVTSQFIVDEINERLEKMFRELLYCMEFMFDIVHIREIRADITVYDDNMMVLKKQVFELVQSGYPETGFSFAEVNPNWIGSIIKTELEDFEEET